MIKLRYKPLRNGMYSVYLDIYLLVPRKYRTYEFLKLYVSKDYSDESIRVKEEDVGILKAAKGIRAKRELEVLSGEYGLKQEKLYEEVGFLDFLEKAVKKKRTNKDVNQSLLKYVKEFVGTQTLSFQNINKAWCDDFKQFLFGKITNNSVRSYLSVLKLFFNMAIEKGHLLKNPMDNVTLPKHEEVMRTTLSVEELRLLQQTETSYGYQLRETFFFACFTGLRLADIKHLTWESIQGDIMVIRQRKSRAKIMRVPLTEAAKGILESLPAAGPLVFSQFTINKSTISDYLKIWGLKAGIKQHVHFHCARHTFATIGISYGIDVYTMKELLGHSKIEMTQIYAKLVDEKKQSEVSKFPNL